LSGRVGGGGGEGMPDHVGDEVEVRGGVYFRHDNGVDVGCAELGCGLVFVDLEMGGFPCTHHLGQVI